MDSHYHTGSQAGQHHHLEPDHRYRSRSDHSTPTHSGPPNTSGHDIRAPTGSRHHRLSDVHKYDSEGGLHLSIPPVVHGGPIGSGRTSQPDLPAPTPPTPHAPKCPSLYWHRGRRFGTTTTLRSNQPPQMVHPLSTARARRASSSRRRGTPHSCGPCLGGAILSPGTGGLHRPPFLRTRLG